MHRHGCLVLGRQQSLSTVRCASTAAQLKPREWTKAGPSHEQPAPSGTPTLDQSAKAKAAALRAKFAQKDAARKPFKPPNDAPRGSSSFQDRGKAPWQPKNAQESWKPRDQNQNSFFKPRQSEGGQRLSFDTRRPGQPTRTQFDFRKPGANEAKTLKSNQTCDSAPQSAAQGTRTSAVDEPSQEAVEDAVEPTEAEPSHHSLDHGRSSKSRVNSNKFKSRGSLLQSTEEEPSLHTSAKRQSTQHVHKPKVVKPRTNQRVERKKVEVYIPSTVSVANLARILRVKPIHLQQKIQQVGITDKATHDYVLTADYAALLAEEFHRTPVIDDEAAFDLYPPQPHSDPSTLPYRPPIVTIMGHVDHGKTTLLDSLRSTAVAKGEAGGITQHIGAFSVPVKSEADGVKSITFLDTPGHAAFSAMRARGAGVTDIIVLVVAADDGLMPQTKEVIELYKKHESSVGLVVAINKVDKPAADVEMVEKALLAEGIQLESYGGDIPSVAVSGLTGKGLPDLVETLSLVAEMKDLRAEANGHAFGEILESRVQQGLGMVGTVLVTRGSLKVGSHIISGQSYAKVRTMTNCSGKTVKVANPGMAVTVSGWKTLPQAGDNIIEGSEADVKKALTNRTRKAEIESALLDVDAINESRRSDRELRESETPQTKSNHFEEIITDSGKKELRLVIKADVSGSAEAVEGALQGIGNNVATSRIISTGVGDVSESDVMLAKAANASIVAFSVGVPRPVQAIANQNSVPILTSNIIYKLMDDVRDRVRELLPKVIETKVTGEATVLQLFEIALKGKAVKKVAGCRVANGLIEKSKFARVIRNGETLYEGSLDTLKQLKKDVTEVRKGTECGLSLDAFTDIREGDTIQMFERIEKLATL